MKPEKIIYKDQNAAWEKSREYITKFLEKYSCIREAHIWASLAESKFGVYKDLYKNRTCSDVDLVIVINKPDEIPKEWKNTGVEKSWFDLYHLGYFEYQGNKHQIDGLIVIPSKHDLNKMKKAILGRSKRIK